MKKDAGFFIPTLRDVAERAAVSLATADRVVNRRPGVRPATIDRVEAAIRELGFERHAAAAALARRTGFKAAALLPRSGNPFIARLAEELVQAARTEGLRRLDLAIVETDTLAPGRLAEAIRQAACSADGVVAIGLDHIAVRAAIDDAAAKGVPVVTLVSDVPGSARYRYVGINNRAAGRVAASLIGRFAAPGTESLLVLLGSYALRDHRDRLDGFRDVLAERFPSLSVSAIVEGEDDPALTRDGLRRAFPKDRRPAAIYSIGGGIAGLAEALSEARERPVVVAHELTVETLPLLRSRVFDALIVQDPGHEARSAIRVLMAALTGSAISEDQERIRIEILLEDNLPR